MRALVTGCAGFVGSHLSEQLLAQGHEVVGVDCFTDYYPRAVKDVNLRQAREAARFSLREIDLASEPLAALTALLEGIDVVYHQAAQPGVRSSWGEHFEDYVRNNVLATQRLLEASKAHRQRLAKFVYASSSSIYGDAEAFPTNESIRPAPISPYGVTKLAGEQLAFLYWRHHGVPTLSLRYFAVYGPRQRPDMAFHRFIRAALRDEPIQVYGTGEQTRDFTFVSDVVAANLAAGDSRGVGMPINVGGGSRVSLNHVIGMLGDLLGRRLRVQHLATESSEVRDTSADTFAAAKVLGFAPRVDLRSGLTAELRWIEAGL